MEIENKLPKEVRNGINEWLSDFKGEIKELNKLSGIVNEIIEHINDLNYDSDDLKSRVSALERELKLITVTLSLLVKKEKL